MNQQFKINTSTQKAAIYKMEIVAQLMKKCNLSYADWADVLFETGCKFIEKNIAIGHLQVLLLQNKKLGFWDWWLVLSIEDDEMILSYKEVNSMASYVNEKQRMLHLLEPQKQFDFFMIKNEKLNELEKV
jgi:hypothetical protein